MGSAAGIVLAWILTGAPAGADPVIVDPSTTWRASVSSGGIGEPDGPSSFPVISRTGRFVVFSSDASNLVAGDTNGGQDVFVHDRATLETMRVSVATGDGQARPGFMGSTYPSISWDGNVIAFVSDASGLVEEVGGHHVYVHGLARRETRLVSVSSGGEPGNGFSSYPAVSGDGRFVAFESDASNLVPGDTNDENDIFVYELRTGETTRVSVASDGTQANSWTPPGPPSISRTGRFVAFSSNASNLVAGDTNGVKDIFIHDRITHRTRRASVGWNGQQANGSSASPALSGDGSVVAFKSWATNLAPGDSNDAVDVYVRDLAAATTTIVSVSSTGEQANGVTVLDDIASKQAISGSGRFIVMLSWATNLSPGGTGLLPDVFVHDRQTGQTWRASVGQSGLPGPGLRYGGAISADGRHVTFVGTAATLVAGALNPTQDILVRSRGEGVCAPSLAACVLDR